MKPRRSCPIRAFWLLALLAAVFAAGRAWARPPSPRLVERPDWQRFFDAAGVTGTMVLARDGAPEMFVFHPGRAATPFLPASTFKILNMAIALETGAITGPDELFPYDGVPRALPQWNADLTVRQAFALSCVPVFQQIARRIGQDRMAWYVAASGYGNADIAGGLDHFWLDGSLRISVLEQIAFLSRLQHGQLPFSPQTRATVLDVMVESRTPTTVLRSKTGATGRNRPGVGWYVGMVSRGDEVWYFALNIDLDATADIPAALAARKTVARAILRSQGLF